MRAVPCPVTERWNASTHCAGIGLALAGLGYLFFLPGAGSWARGTQVIYVLSLVNVYTASSLFHFFGGTNERLLRWDRSSVYGVIAASYFAVHQLLPQVALPDWVPIAVVAFGILGILGECTLEERILSKLAPPFIFMLIWFGIPFGNFSVDPHAQLVLYGVCTYSLGAFFNVADIWLAACHVVWHLAVVIGSGLHFAAFVLAVI